MAKLAILTSGGDSPGMNAVIRACVRTGIHHGMEIFGVHEGYQGLMDDLMEPMDLRSVANIIQRGGTILKSARCNEMMRPEGVEKAIATLKKREINHLIVIGGDGSLKGAKAIDDKSDVNVVGVPATIDNDVGGTNYTIGFDTAVNTALSSIDRIRDTAASHNRVFIVEVMGRNTGFLAASVGLAGGAEAVFVPEATISVDAVAQKLKDSAQRGKNSSILIAAEGQKPGRAYDLAEALRKKVSIEAKVCVLGHIQRGGTPSARDRIVGSQMGAAAVNALAKQVTGVYIGVRSGSMVEAPFATAEDKKSLDGSLLPLTEILSQ